MSWTSLIKDERGGILFVSEEGDIGALLASLSDYEHFTEGEQEEFPWNGVSF